MQLNSIYLINILSLFIYSNLDDKVISNGKDKKHGEGALNQG